MKKILPLFILLTGLMVNVSSQALTPGNIVLLRTGDGIAALGSGASEVSLLEYTIAGIATGNIVTFPSGATGIRLTQSGSATTEGDITVSQDGRSITVAGYDAAAGTPTVASGTDNLTIANVPFSNISAYTTNYQFLRTGAYTGNSFRAAVTTNGTQYWGSGLTGGSGGIRYINTSGTPVAGTQVSTTVQNTRSVQIFGNQLYCSSAALSVATVGVGLPTAAGNTITTLLGGSVSTIADPYSFILFNRSPLIPGFDALYITHNTSNTINGIQKFYFDGTNWINAGQLVGAAGRCATRITGYINCSNQVELYIGTGPNGGRTNTIYKFTDAAAYNANITSNGSDIGAVGTTIISAAANFAFGGVAVVSDPKLVITTNTSIPAGTYGDIFITNSATATLSGNITITGTLTVQSGATLDAGTYTISSSSTATGTPGGIFMLETGSIFKTANANGITASATSGAVQTCIRNYPPGAKYHYTGSVAQVTGDGLPATITGALVINNSSGIAGSGVTLSQPTTIATPAIITFTNGKLTTSAVNLLTVSNPANNAIAGGSANSFICGPLRRFVNNGLLNYILPMGKGTSYGYAALLAPSAASNFMVEYFNVPAPQPIYDFTLKDPTLNHISTCHYWVISLTGGPTSARVTLSWDAINSCGGVTTLSDLRIAHWTGALWHDEGNGFTSGNTTAGTFTTITAISSFSPFTLSSLTTTNPLPVSLISFSGICETNRTELHWTTASEENNSYFTIDKSLDGITYHESGRVTGAGNSNTLISYDYNDMEKGFGNHYYRLSQTDLNGETTFFDPIYISCNSSSSNNDEPTGYIVSSSADNITLNLFTQSEGDVNIMLADNLGRNMGVWNKQIIAGLNTISISPGITNSGIYILNISGQKLNKSFKIFIR